MDTLDRCPICDADAAWAKCLHRRRRDVLYRCRRCRCLFANPRYSPDELAELYRKEYYETAAPTASRRAEVQTGAEVLHRTVLSHMRRCFGRTVRPGAKLLDYGCGLGFFLAEARKMGLEGVGVELSAAAAAFAREQLGLAVIAGDESALERLPAGGFDVVTAWECIEHVLEPWRVLQLLVSRLAPGGVLGLSFPNLGCWRYRLEGGRWFNIENPTHVNFYTWPGIRRALTDLGMGEVRRAVFWGGRPRFGPAANLAQYLVRLLHLGSDLRVFARRP